MKLILLPGMDGTGELFTPLLEALPEYDYETIRLPESGAQDYLSITEYVIKKLPKHDYLLVAESFSGPIGLMLASRQLQYLKGIVFVATFLSPPNKFLLAMAQFLPLKFFTRLPFVGYFHKVLFLGKGANAELLASFQSIIKSLPQKLIMQRLKAMAELEYQLQTIDLPAVYIQASADKLVSSRKAAEFADTFRQLKIRKVDGPHFILQLNPHESASIISAFCKSLKS